MKHVEHFGRADKSIGLIGLPIAEPTDQNIVWYTFKDGQYIYFRTAWDLFLYEGTGAQVERIYLDEGEEEELLSRAQSFDDLIALKRSKRTSAMNNKLIAEFMGLEILDEVRVFGGVVYSPIQVPELMAWGVDEGFCTMRPDQLGYPNDWNWLMPVVEKINGLLHDDGEFQFHMIISPEKVTIWDNDDGGFIVEQPHGSSNMEMIYLAIVEFIEWYNLNRKA